MLKHLRSRRRALAPLAGAAALASCLAPAAPAQEISNPGLYTKSLEAAAQALRFYGASEDAEEIERVNRIGYELALHSGYDRFPFSFYVVEMPIPNAFALPAGHIFVTRGMLDLGLSDDMLAGLLGHEIAHVTQEHFLRMRKRATLLNVLSQLLTVGAMAAASNSNSDSYYGPYGYTYDNPAASIAQGVAAAGVVMSELLLRSYSRENEDESDEEGQRMAAAAGYDPDGTRQLMAKMKERLPQTRSFGYWQTHPFFEERVRAADARQGSFTVREASKPVAPYRQQTQTQLLAFFDAEELPAPLARALKQSALAAWPQGEAADGLRQEKLHEMREWEMEKRSLARDYGKLLDAYDEEMDQIREATPNSAMLHTLGQELGELKSEMVELYPKAVTVLEGGVFETSFLEAFLSNYPDAKELPTVALHLGLAYSRLEKQTPAVESFLKAWETAPGSEEGRQAMTGLRNLAPVLNQLGALAHLASQETDEELRSIAEKRLQVLVKSYDQIQNGAEYLRRFPEGDYVLIVTDRLNALAENLYREMVLYQQVGDTARAIERAKRILTYAPYSPAAEKLSSEDFPEGPDPA